MLVNLVLPSLLVSAFLLYMYLCGIHSHLIIKIFVHHILVYFAHFTHSYQCGIP